jgi:hypothetical protein
MCGVVLQVINLIRPHFFYTTLNGNTYTNFLLNILPTLLEGIPFSLRLLIWFQQDDASPHYARSSRNALNISYPKQMDRKRKFDFLAARSLDITSLDFFYGALLKKKFFRQNLQHLMK